ncbi:HAD-IA family hydrolase [Sphingomonas panacisoli]|uniref:HAD-IA family hydrolase n=1 Tax=Sphingomonas panacisoli TaxID=1813879 RepID=A0A5B8LFK4_9SPHN|nr:HAD-IA family hydrolase [Sphingomonas panacisoli]QDZ06639.1 HAD-IA family hydrolase [Sphingomonas panacisoli]
MSRLVIFDCDGTLVDSQANICRAVEEAFVEARVAVPPRDAIRRIVGLSLVEAMQALLPEAADADHRILAQGYKDKFVAMRASGMLDEEPLFDGIGSLVERLARDGWLLGVATGKSDRGLDRVLATHGLAHHFVTLQTADRHPSKPHPSMIAAAIAEAGADPARTAMIGDTTYDVMMAVNAGVRAIGVGWGYHEPDELTAAGAHGVALAVADLPHHLEL